MTQDGSRVYRIWYKENVISVWAKGAIEAVQGLSSASRWSLEVHLGDGKYREQWKVECPNSGETLTVYRDTLSGSLTLMDPAEEADAAEDKALGFT